MKWPFELQVREIGEPRRVSFDDEPPCAPYKAPALTDEQRDRKNEKARERRERIARQNRTRYLAKQEHWKQKARERYERDMASTAR